MSITKTKIITIQKTIKLWILSSVATLEAHKTEERSKKKCYKYTRNTTGVNLEWFLTARTVATTPRISIFMLSLPKLRAQFLNGPHFLHLYFSKTKNDTGKRVAPFWTTCIGKLRFKTWAQSDEIKIVKNCCKRKVRCRNSRKDFSTNYILNERHVKKCLN